MQVNCVFWASGEPIHAFKHCRPVLSIDGSHMYWKGTAKLLVVVALDANNHLLSVCYAIVESESSSRWKWFKSCIQEGVTAREGLCIISNRHPGLMSAMNEPEWSPPYVYHRVCVRHLQSNFMVMVKVKDVFLKEKLGSVAYQRKELNFKAEYIEQLELLHDKPEVRRWLEDVDVELWSHAFDTGGFRWGSMTTNAFECFNDIQKGVRDLPISLLVMFTFKQTTTYFVNHN
ncbi:hypothetical protein QQ045_028346 [Rhodiola kirilowii]